MLAHVDMADGNEGEIPEMGEQEYDEGGKEIKILDSVLVCGHEWLLILI